MNMYSWLRGVNYVYPWGMVVRQSGLFLWM